VTLSMAATQFGPRLIGAFLKSGIAKATIGIFTGLFVYSLLVLDSVATTGDTNQQVPILGTTISLVMAIVAVTCLVWYANAMAQSVRLPRVVQVLADDLRAAVTQTATSSISRRMDSLPDQERAELTRHLDADGTDLVADTSGYLQQIELQPLLDAATRSGAVVWCAARPGDFVMAGTRLVRITPSSAAHVLAPMCEQSIDLGAHRTIDQDVEFAIDQMVEIALRALSPAINDTFTAITCIDWLGTALRFLAETNTDRPVLRDDAGIVRVLTRPRPFPGLVDAAYDKIRQAGADNPAITIHLIDTISQVVDLVDGHETGGELMVQAHMVVAGAHTCRYTSRDWDGLYSRYTRLCTTVGVTPLEFN